MTMDLTAWHGDKDCFVVHKSHYPIAQAGTWAECIRRKQPVVCNDLPHCPHRPRLPQGHIHLWRFMTVPVVDGDKVKMVLGVGNKAGVYDDNDVVQLQLLANELCKITAQRHAEEALRQSEELFRTAFASATVVVWLASTGNFAAPTAK